jgi:hypothetical protein
MRPGPRPPMLTGMDARAATDYAQHLRDAGHDTRPGSAPRVVDVGWRRLLTVKGSGEPGGDEFQAAVRGLMAVAHGIRFALRRKGLAGGRVGNLEGFFDLDGRTWTLAVAADDAVTPELVEQVREHSSRAATSPAAAHVRLTELCERRAVEAVHVGPYDEQGPTIERLHRFAREQGLALRGRQHEIYLSDPRRTASERLRTMIRQPVS